MDFDHPPKHKDAVVVPCVKPPLSCLAVVTAVSSFSSKMYHPMIQSARVSEYQGGPGAFSPAKINPAVVVPI